jgi:hypothetical protein
MRGRQQSAISNPSSNAKPPQSQTETSKYSAKTPHTSKLDCISSTTESRICIAMKIGIRESGTPSSFRMVFSVWKK